MYQGTHIGDAVAYVEEQIVSLLSAVPGIDSMFEVKDNDGTVSVLAMDPKFDPFCNVVVAHFSTAGAHMLPHGLVVYRYVDPVKAADPSNESVFDAFGFHNPTPVTSA